MAYAREECNSFDFFDNSMGCWWIRPNQAIPKPQTLYSRPLWPAASTLERNPQGIRNPPFRQNSNMPTQKYILRSSGMAGPFFFCLAQVLSGCHGDGPYCTGRQRERQPSLWATDRPCLPWKDFDGAKKGGGGGVLHREVSVSWETTVIVCPSPKVPPVSPHLPTPFYFLSPSLVVHKLPSWVKEGLAFA